MEAEKWLGPTLTLVITTETLKKTLIYSVISSAGWIHTPPLGCLPPRVQGCGGAVQPD